MVDCGKMGSGSDFGVCSVCFQSVGDKERGKECRERWRAFCDSERELGLAIDRGNTRVYCFWLHLKACQLHGKA